MIIKVKINLVASLCLLFQMVFAENYYVSAKNGIDENMGLSPDKPLLTINRALSECGPGDTVFVMAGTYSAPKNRPTVNVVTIEKSGTEWNWIVLINYKTDSPLISFQGWTGIKIAKGASYIEIRGFTIRGNNGNIILDSALNQPRSCSNPYGTPSPFYNGSGISTNGREEGKRSHHIRIIGNTIYECGESGISLIQADYVTIEENKVFNNSWYTIYAGSGISLYQLWNADNNTTDYRNIILNNKCYGNRLFVPWVYAPCKITDGNGIIIDDSKNTQNNSKNGRYNGRTLIAFNTVFNNGGSGIHSFMSEHVDIFNNTAYKNQQSKEIDEGEIFANGCNDVKMYNNILVADSTKRICSNWNNNDVHYDYNIYWGGKQEDCAGSHSKIIDPDFKNPSKDPLVADFHLRAFSPALVMGNIVNNYLANRVKRKTIRTIGALLE